MLSAAAVVDPLVNDGATVMPMIEVVDIDVRFWRLLAADVTRVAFVVVWIDRDEVAPIFKDVLVVVLGGTIKTRIPSALLHRAVDAKMPGGLETIGNEELSGVCDPTKLLIVIDDDGKISQLIWRDKERVVEAEARGLLCRTIFLINFGTIVNKGSVPFSTPSIIRPKATAGVAAKKESWFETLATAETPTSGEDCAVALFCSSNHTA
jgi:hypothetical protein